MYNSSRINVLKLLLLVSLPIFSLFLWQDPMWMWSDAVLHYPAALPELWVERLSSSLWPASCSRFPTLAVAYSPLLGGKGKRQAFTSLYMQKKHKCHLPRYIIYVRAVTASDWLTEINYTWYNSSGGEGGEEKKVISYHANTLCKYHWFSMNSFWPAGLRLLLCDVHNSLNTGPLLLLGVGGQACSVKSKRISSPINNQLQDCSPNDRPEKSKGRWIKSGETCVYIL